MNPIALAWDWLKTAPLPVVVAITLVLGGWVYALENKVKDQQTVVAVAAERSATAAETARRIEEKLDTLFGDKLKEIKEEKAEKAKKKESK